MKKTQTIFLLFFLIVAACSNPIDQAKQNELIEYNQIRIGMNCANLTDMLGGYRAITYLYLEKKDLPPSLANSYLLLSTSSNNTNKNFFLCERTSIKYLRIRQKVKKHIKDYDLIKIYKDPLKMIKYVLGVTSNYTRNQIVSRVNLLDYNLNRDEVNKIYDDVLQLERELLEEEGIKAEKLLKEEIKKEKENIPEDEDQKILRKKLLEELNKK